MTSRRQYGAAIVACVAGAGLALLALRQGWARVDYAAPRPLPSGSIPVSGQDLLLAAGALALAALACLAAIIATRGLARRVAGLALAGLGAWIAVEVTQPLHAATVIAAASGQAVAGRPRRLAARRQLGDQRQLAFRRRSAADRRGQPGGPRQRSVAPARADRGGGGDRRWPPRRLARAQLGGDVGPVRPAGAASPERRPSADRPRSDRPRADCSGADCPAADHAGCLRADRPSG